MKIKQIFCMITMIPLLSACVTSAMWTSDRVPEVVSQTQQISNKIDSDAIYAFAQTTQNGEAQLVMMGTRYWYLLYSEHTSELLRLTQAKLSGKISVKPIEIDLYESQEFSGDILLHYYAQDKKEIEELTALGFNAQHSEQLYTKLYEVEGKIYQNPKGLSQDYTFSKQIPVDIVYYTKNAELNGGVLLGKLALTPFSLLIDAIGTPAMLFEEITE